MKARAQPPDQPWARDQLGSDGGDVESGLQECGGYCDCEVIFNVSPRGGKRAEMNEILFLLKVWFVVGAGCVIAILILLTIVIIRNRWSER